MSKSKVDPWAGARKANNIKSSQRNAIKKSARKRTVRGSNGILTETLNEIRPRGSVSAMRKAFSGMAKATAGEISDGRNSTFTRSFAAREIPKDHVWNQVDDAYKTLHSYLPGSVAHALLSLHCLGFRIFSKSGGATSFLLTSTIADDEAKLAKQIDASDLFVPYLTISNLFNTLNTGIRGKGENTSKQPLVTRFYTTFTGKPLAKDAKGLEVDFANSLAEILVEKYKTWKQMVESPLNSYLSIVPELEKHGITINLISAIQKLEDASGQKGKLKHRTIAFDSDLSILDNSRDPAFIIMALTARYAQEANIEGVKPAKHVKEKITTTNANGLGWLLNKAPSLLPAATDEELREFIGTDRSNACFNDLLEVLKQLRAPGLFVGNTLPDVRTNVQGMIDSMLSNHIARLSDSLDSLRNAEKFNFEEFNKQIQHVISNSEAKDELSLQGFDTKASLLVEHIKNGIDSAGILLGQTDLVISAEVVDQAIGGYKQALSGIDQVIAGVRTINSLAKRNLIPHDEIEFPECLNSLIALPFIGSTIIDVAEDRRNCRNQIELAKNELHRIEEALCNKYDLSGVNAVKERRKHFIKACSETNRTALIDPVTVSYRDLLSRLCRAVYRCSNTTKKIAYSKINKTGIFENNDELREHLYDRKHFVHVHPLDTKPKKLLRLTNQRVDLVVLIDQILEDVVDGKDLNVLWLCRNGILLSALPDTIETKYVSSDLLMNKGDHRYLLDLDEPVISKEVVQAHISVALRSSVSGMQYRLSKSEFSIIRTLSPYLAPSIVYVPKNKMWKVPKQMFDGLFSSVLSSEDMVWHKAGTLNCFETVKRIAVNKSNKDSLIHHAFLKEVPHEFYIKTDIESYGVDTFGVVINDGQITQSGVIKNMVPFRIDRRNTEFVAVLNGLFSGGKVSPPSIQFCRQYRVIDDDVVECTSKRRVIFQMPTAMRVGVADEGGWNPRHVIGIDPGNYGAGLSLTRLDGEKIDSGFIHVNSLINYLKKKEEHRVSTTPKQQYKAAFSDHLVKAQDGAVGDICYIIDQLIVEYDAIPVFEMLSNSDPSYNVWSAVTSRYTWGDNDAQNATRSEHWFGAKAWETSLLRHPPMEKKAKPFVARPGFSVSSYGNSQKCSCCGRNVIEDIRAMADGRSLAVIDGSVLLDGGSVYFEGPDAHTLSERKAKGLPPLWAPVEHRKFDKLKPTSSSTKEMITMAKRSIRRNNKFNQKKTGIEALFVCPYTDCAAQLNADANSAINVAHRAIEQLT